MDFLFSETGSGWMTLTSTVLAALSLIATIVIAINTGRLDRRVHEETRSREDAERRRERIAALRDHKSAVRERIGAFDDEYLRWIDAAEDATTDAAGLRRQGHSLIATMESVGGDARGLAISLDLLDAQTYWVADAVRHRHWVAATHGQNADDADWVSGVTNSMLDVVKDHVLSETAFEEELALLADDFWVDLATRYFHEESARKDIRARPHDAVLVAAQRRWLPATAIRGAEERISALIRYKVLAEHALALGLYGEFTDGLHHAPREDKFVASNRHLVSLLRAEITERADAEITRLDGEIAAILASKV